MRPNGVIAVPDIEIISESEIHALLHGPKDEELIGAMKALPMGQAIAVPRAKMADLKSAAKLFPGTFEIRLSHDGKRAIAIKTPPDWELRGKVLRHISKKDCTLSFLVNALRPRSREVVQSAVEMLVENGEVTRLIVPHGRNGTMIEKYAIGQA